MPPIDERFDDGATLLVFAHQDDDLLWMQPFQDSAAVLLLAASPPAPAHAGIVAQHPERYRERWRSLFPRTATDQDWIDGYGLRDRCDRERDWNLKRISRAVEPWVARPGLRRIVTHNNWGEYGHIHHRWVSRAVREAAVRHGKDVWMLNTQVVFREPGEGADYLDLGDWDLPSVRMAFCAETFYALRDIYLRTAFDANPRGVSTWTWLKGDDQYPQGERTFVKVVEQGVDHTQTHPLVRQTVAELEKRVPVSGACTRSFPESQ